MAALNQDVPPPPPGFSLDGDIPPPPSGFTLDGAPSAKTGAKYIAGRTARLGANAVTGLPLMLADAANGLIDMTTGGINKVAGTNIPALGSPSKTVTGILDKFTPASTTPIEKISDVGANALGGAGLFKAAATALPRILPELPRLAQIIQSLGEGPGLQTAGAMAGATATEGAQEAGIKNPLALTGIGMMGSILPGAGPTIAGRTLGGAVQAARPFTQGGRNVIVGKALNRVATNPSQAQETLATAEAIVPGSLPTVSQSSRDPGLISAETAMRGLDTTGVIPARLGEQNKARQDYIYSVAGDEAALEAAKKHQKAAYDELADPAFKAKTPIKIGRDWIDNPVLRTIQSVRETPSGARQTVQNAMDHAQELLTQPGVDLSDAETLYAIRKDLALARDGKLVGQGKSGIELSNLKNSRAQLNTVIDSLDDTIETGAPGFKNYLDVFHKRSIPLDQLKALQTLRSRAELSVSDQTTQTPILGNKFQTLLKNNLDSGLNLRGKGPKAGNLTPQQMGVLSRVAADLDRSSASSASTMKVPGSDTFKNMSVASVIGRVLGDDAGAAVSATTGAKTLTKGTFNPLAWLYHAPDQEIQQLMLQAWLDPKLAGRLMKQATQHEIDSVAAELKDRFAKQMTAQSIYGAAE